MRSIQNLNMKTITVLIILSIMLTGCGTSKRVVKTDTEIQSSIEKSKRDSTSSITALQSIVERVVSQVDLSQIRIITYYPTADSSGRQPVREEILIDRNITTSVIDSEKKDLTIEQSSASVEQSQQDTQIKQSIDVKEKKSGIPIKYYIIVFFVIAGVGYLTYRFIRHRFF